MRVSKKVRALCFQPHAPVASSVASGRIVKDRVLLALHNNSLLVYDLTVAEKPVGAIAFLEASLCARVSRLFVYGV